MAKKKAPLTGFGVGNAMLEVMSRQVAALAERQSTASEEQMADLDGRVANLSRSVAALVAELRKSVKDAEDAVAELAEEQRVTLILGLVEKLSPEFRRAIGLHIQQLGDRLIQ